MPKYVVDRILTVPQITEVESKDIGKEHVTRDNLVVYLSEADPCPGQEVTGQLLMVYKTPPFPMFTVGAVYLVDLKKETLVEKPAIAAKPTAPAPATTPPSSTSSPAQPPSPVLPVLPSTPIPAPMESSKPGG